MNRNERRAQEKAQEKQSKAQVTLARAQSLKAQGMALKAAGQDAEAALTLLEALKADSTMADVHFALAIMERTKPHIGLKMEDINRNIRDKKLLSDAYVHILHIMKMKKQYKEALICQEELCRLMPANHDEKINLALLYNINGENLSALHVLAQLIEEYPAEPRYRGVFSNLCGSSNLAQTNPLLKNALQSCFENIYQCNLYKVFPLWLRLILTDPFCIDLHTAQRLESAEEFDLFLEKTTPSKISFVNYPLFLDGLRLLIVTELTMERILMNMRRWLCLNAPRLAADGRLQGYENFICALGEQLFFNEYIYSQTAEETQAIDYLVSAIRASQDTGLSRLQSYALVSCYRPLHETFPDAGDELTALAQTSPAFARLVTAQFDNPRTENNLRPTLSAFGRMQNDVSKKVQAQYEEHPYPRWISMPAYAMPNDDLPFPEEERYKPYRVLVAGCGTGRQALSAAAHYPSARVTAIDLSRTSLAYGKRKAQEAGLADRIDFIHADILDMKDWDGQFNIIECSGVLHHMEDPFAGWKTLNDLLVPDGYFKIGLYSELARKQIVEARKFIAEKGYSSTDEGIRACRQEIIALPADHPMRQRLLGANDFFSMSLLRDFIFHVQEHRMTLPQIQEMMSALKLACISINVPGVTHVLGYEKMFPQDIARTNLSNWHIYEEKNPDTFVSMYQFWARKMP